MRALMAGLGVVWWLPVNLFLAVGLSRAYKWGILVSVLMLLEFDVELYFRPFDRFLPVFSVLVCQHAGAYFYLLLCRHLACAI
jgi:hypothetical protein